jgi:hypothetical protein
MMAHLLPPLGKQQNQTENQIQNLVMTYLMKQKRL